jgi:hypothetical protein
MDYLFIDTSIWESSNFLEGKRIREILRLAEEGQVQILMPVITYNEIKNRANQNIKAAVDRHKKSRDETRVLRNIDEIKSKFEPIDLEKTMRDFEILVDESLKKAKFILLNYPTVNIKEVFEKYFANDFPFSKGDKKHEFPDAFALLTIENWCKENKKKCCVITSDNDLVNYKSKHLDIYKGLDDFVDGKLRQIEIEEKRQSRLAKIAELYDQRMEQLETEIENWLFNQLDDFTPYYTYFETDVHDIKVQENFASLTDFKIVSVRDDSIQIEAEAKIEYKIEVTVDDENTRWYDDDDKEYKYFETEIQIIEDEQIIPITFKIDIPLLDEDVPLEIMVDEINRGKSLHL